MSADERTPKVAAEPWEPVMTWLARPQTIIGLSAVVLSLYGLFAAVYEASLPKVRASYFWLLLFLIVGCDYKTPASEDEPDRLPLAAPEAAPAPSNPSAWADSTAGELASPIGNTVSTANELGCRCSGVYERFPLRFQVQYTKEHALIACAESASGPPERLETHDFGVFECQGNELYMSVGNTRHYVQADTIPISISEARQLPGKTGLFEEQRFMQESFVLIGDSFQIRREAVYAPPRMAASRRDSLIALMKSVQANPSAAAYVDYNPETLVAELFWCGFEGDVVCLSLFEDARPLTDASSTELWFELAPMLRR